MVQIDFAADLDKALGNPQAKAPPMPGSLSALLAERGRTHGEYSDHAQITQDIKVILRGHGYFKLTPDKIETLDMIAHKIGRILAGDPEVEDHWRDIAGYATLSADRVVK